ncbi:MAG: sensor histidine kinase [Candidatus Thiodiazotropha sp. (ex Notomyrtea botanica)]|nr:sensor histidine kinase [Candidatus Thiodiazotropha sp. (ex Notomyrtea botanica)]
MTITKADKMTRNEEICRMASLDPMLSLVRESFDVNQKTTAYLSMSDRLSLLSQIPSSQVSELPVAPKMPDSAMSSEEEEKKRISRELHDGLGQILTSINLHIQNCLSGCESQDQVELPQGIKDSLAVISDMTKQAMGEVRSICGALRPAILDDLGVLAAISWQCRQISLGCSRLDVETHFDLEESMIPETYKTVIYRIVQEGLNNAVKYSQTKSVIISLFQEDESIQLVIRDFGIGFDLDQVRSEQGMGMGLMSMRERAESIGGSCEVNAATGRGVEIRVGFPVEKVALSG